MTTHTITFDANVFTDEDGHEPATINLRAQAFRPAGWAVPLAGDTFAVKNILEFDIDPDEPTIELEATGTDDWCWHVGVRHPDLETVWERFFYLNADTNFADLVDLDPYSLDPAADATPAWYLELESRVPEDGTDGFVLTKGTPDNVWSPGIGAGDVVGPASSDDNRIVRMDGTTGKLIQQSPVSIDDAGAMTGMSTVDGRDLSVDGAKLDGIEDGATANATDAQLRDRATHTGTQPANTITGLAPVATSGDYDDLTDKPTALPPNGAAGGVLSGTYPNPGFAADMATQAELDAEALTRAAEDLALQADIDGHEARTDNPHSVTKAQVGLGNVDNTSDANKPVSTAQAAADALKLDKAANLSDVANAGTARTNLGLGTAATHNNGDYDPAGAAAAAQAASQPLDADLTAIGSLNSATANVIASDGAGWIAKTYAQLKTALGLTKADVGLSNVDNVQQQPLDSDLTTIAGLTPTTDNFMQAKASAWASRTPAQVKTDLSLPADTVGDLAGKQPLDSDLTTIAGLTATTDSIMQAKAGAWAARTLAQLWTDLKDLAVTLTNKTIALGSNTISGTTAQFNTALTDNDFATLAGAETLTSKRITKRVLTNADIATLTIDSDSYDAVKVTALAQAMTIANPTGTPSNMQGLMIRIKDNGTARALTWGANFRVIGVTLPTTTVISKTLYVGCVWNNDDSKWDVIAVAQQA